MARTMDDGLDTLPIKELRALAQTELSTGSRLVRKAEIIPALRKHRATVAALSEPIPAQRQSKAAKKAVAPEGWAEVIGQVLTAGSAIVKVAQEGAGRPFYFLVSNVEPTRKGGDFAWVVGKRVTAAGKPTEQISHLHCPEGERTEFLSIARVSLGSSAK